MDLQLAGRVAVVTGGTSGIGLSAVRRFLAEGAAVAFCARNGERVTALADELGSAGHPVFGIAADVRDAGAMNAFADRVAERFGGADVLVANACEARMRSYDELDDDDWRDEFELKFFGVLRPFDAFAPQLRRSEIGNIVYLSSLLAKVPEPRLIASAAARAGALNLMKSLSFELAPAGIRVNSILLGVIDTGQWERRWQTRVANGDTISRDAYIREIAADRGIPLGRMGTPDEVAAAIAFLASPLSGFTSGAMLEISGGFSRHV